MHSRLLLAIVALSLGGCIILAAPAPAFAQTGERQKTAPSGADNKGKSAAPRKSAPLDRHPAVEHSPNEEQRTKQSEQDRQGPGQHTRTHSSQRPNRQISALPERKHRHSDDNQTGHEVLAPG